MYLQKMMQCNVMNTDSPTHQHCLPAALFATVYLRLKGVNVTTFLTSESEKALLPGSTQLCRPRHGQSTYTSNAAHSSGILTK